MLIGVDFDNTIVSYDALFHRIATERGLIPADLPVNKTAVRDHLRATGREEIWTEMQGEVYGARMAEAAPFPGVREFFRVCRERGVAVVIISHKTRHPFRGEQHDLHTAARTWLALQGFFDAAGAGLRDEAVHFELTKADKITRIRTAGCTHFIDDLPELLTDATFPTTIERLLFDPSGLHVSTAGVRSMRSWRELPGTLLGEESWIPAARNILSRERERPARHGIANGTPALPSPTPTAVAGGANNRVYHLPLEGGRRAIAKRYFRRAGDARDRFATERAFYRFANAAGVTQIPTVFGWDASEQLGVFHCVEGHRPVAVQTGHLDEALRFVTALNESRLLPEASALPIAAEACFSLETHLGAVRQRVAALTEMREDTALDAAAAVFVRDDLRPAWQIVERSILDRYAFTRRAQTLTSDERCISPSDFGFHNSLLTTEDRIVFFDFEYAGWDDPAKLVCDFFCQPDVPAPHEEFDRFIAILSKGLKLRDIAGFAQRCQALLPVYQVKWACILLNEFTPAGRERRAFSLGDEAAASRRARQLARARGMIDTIAMKGGARCSQRASTSIDATQLVKDSGRRFKLQQVT
jgi:hypothetical protein